MAATHQIGAGVRIEGVVRGDGDLHVAGHVSGELTLSGALTIASGAHVEAQTSAEAITVHGRLEGDLRVTGTLRLHAGAVVVGSAEVGAFVMEEGATFRGQLDMPDVTPSPGAGSTRARATTGAPKPSADTSTPSASSGRLPIASSVKNQRADR